VSTTIDEKVVEMRFDNKQFEAGVQTSLSTLDKLKKGLNLNGAAKGLENINGAARKCDMSTLGKSVEAVKMKFSALEVMAMTALGNITNSALNAGKRIASALTVEPVMTGFNEYETKMGAIQTIMSNTASKGTTMADVTRVIDELNTYADKTIYNFAEMTRNIGTFTAAGVGLEESAKAIQGIANLAAASGSTSQQASTAMYQFSQALAAGTVKLMDWNSVVNAGMGGEKFQEALKVTAREHGIAVDKLIEKNGSFRDSLQEGWISADILNETLNKFTVDGAKAYAQSMVESGKYTQEQADALIAEAQSMEDAATKVKTFSQLWDTLKESAQSGWGKTWEIVIGDFEEAKDLFTEISDTLGGMINDSGDERNNVLFKGLASGWKQLLDQGIADGEGFRQTVLDIAEEHGIAVEKMRDDTALFNQSLKDGWLSSDILSESIDTFASKVGKMSEEELKAAGYTAEQVEQLAALNKAAKNGSISMEEFAGKISSVSGRENLIDALRNSFQGIVNVVTVVSNAFHELFPKATAEQLYSFTEGLKTASEKFKELFSVVRDENGNIVEMSETLAKIKSTFKGLFAVVDIVRQAFSAVFNAVKPLLGGIGSLGGGILDLTASFGDWLVELDETIKKGGTFNNVCQNITGFVKAAVEKVKEFTQAVKEKFKIPGFEAFHALLERAHERMGQVAESAEGMGAGVSSAVKAMSSALAGSKFMQALEKLCGGIKTIAKTIAGAIGDLAHDISEKIHGSDVNGAIDLLNSISFGTIAAGIASFLSGVKKPFSEAGKFLGNVKDILDEVRGCFEAYQTQLKAGTLLKIAGAIGILAASIVAISLVDSDKLAASLGAITVLFADLMGAMAVFGKTGGDAKGLTKGCAAMLAISTSVLILASALKKIGNLDAKQLAIGMAGITGLMAGLVGSAKVLGSGSGTVMKGAAQMAIFAGAIKVLASACAGLAELEWNELAKGLTGVGALLAEVSLFLNTAKFSGKSVTTATGIVILAAAVKVLASACKDFGQMNWGEIGKGLASIGALLLEIAAFTKLTGNAKHVVSTGIVLVEIAAAMKIFASAMSDFGSLGWDQVAKGLAAMGGALAEVAAAANLMPKNMASFGLGLIAVGAALEIVADALAKMGGMSWEQIAKGLITLGGALAELAIGLNFMNGTLGGSAAMLIASTALAALTPVLVVLGSMSWEGIAKGLAAIAGSFAVFGAAGYLLGPVVPIIAAVSASISLLAVSLAALIAAISAVNITGAVAQIAAPFQSLADHLGIEFLKSLVGLIPDLLLGILNSLKDFIVTFCEIIIEGAPAIGRAMKAIVLTLVDVLVECVPELANGALELLTGVLSALVTYTPQLVDSLMTFLIEVIEGISQKLPDLIKAGVELLGALFSGIVDALSGIDTSALLTGVAAVGLLAAMMAALQGIAALVPGAMIGIVGMGAVIAELALVLAAIGGLAQLSGLSWLISEGGELLKSIGTAIGSFVGGIAGGFMSGVSSQFPQIGADLAAFMTNVQPFIDGVSGIGPDLLTGVGTLTEVILLLTAADILAGLTSWLTGGSSISDFAEQLVPFGEAMSNFSTAISGMDGELVSKAAVAGKTLAEMASTLPNSGGVLGFFAGENDMVAFGSQLGGFGIAMANFANTVKGMDADAVTNAAIAGKAMAEMAATLPNSGGVVGFFTGENDMTVFAGQLVPFGVAIKAYSLAVKGLDVDAVTNSAVAGKAMVELANTVPNCGGVVGFFAGENNLDTFGAQLLSFGISIKAYSLAVKGLDADAVTNSTVAGQALIELARTVPNCGGLVSFFTGENNISVFGDEIVAFGKDLAAYADAIQTVKPEAVAASANAAQALSNLATGLPDSSLFDKLFSGDQTLASFGYDISVFGEYMGYYYSCVSGIDLSKLSAVITQVWNFVDLAKGVKDIDKNAFSNFSSSLSSLANTGITGFTDAFYNCDSEVTSAVTSMLNAVSASITANASIPSSAMQNVVVSLADGIKAKTADVGIATTFMMSTISSKITSYTANIRTAASNVVSAAASQISGMKSEFETAGKNAGQGFINGIKTKLSAASAAGRSLGLAALNAAKKALDSHSPSREFIHLGEYMGEGLAIGVNNSIVPAAQATSGMIGEVIKVSKKGIDAFEEWAEERKYYGDLSLKDELAGWENLQKKYKAGSEERKKIDREVYRLQNELVSATYQASLDWIEEEKYYNRLSTQEELEAYERMQKRYLEGSEERKKIDREVYTLRNQLMDESYQYSMDWIEKEKYYNRMTLSDELAAYKRVQSRYAKGTEEREKMDREVYRVEKEIYEAQQQYIADVQSAQASANQRRLDLEQEYADKVKSINDKLASDIQSLNDKYQDAVESRTNSLYQSYGLFDAVKEREEVSGETLMKNMEGQVKEFGQWQDILDSLSARGLDSELIGELRDMGPSAISELKALNSMSDSELEKYAALWSIKHAQAREQAVSELEGLRVETQNNIAQLRLEAAQELEEYRVTWQQQMDQVTLDVNAELEQLRQDFGEKVGLIKKDTEQEMQEMANAAQEILREAGWDETGKQIVTGITEGVEAEKPNLLSTLAQMAKSAVKAVKDVLKINSPSRVFRELGSYTGLGFVDGLKDYAGKTYDAGANMAESAKDGLSNALSMVAELASGDFDMQPTIRPVLDLSNVTSTAGQLNSLFYPQRTMSLVGQASLAFSSSGYRGQAASAADNDSVVRELRSLRSDMAEMTARLERMRVVLNTGALVGEMAEPMDTALGQRHAFRGRGI